MIFLGALMLIALAVIILIPNPEKPVKDDYSFASEWRGAVKVWEFLNMLKSPFTKGALGLFGTLFVLGNLLVFYADGSTDYVLQYPTGGKSIYINENGIKPRLFASIIPIDHEIIVEQLAPDRWEAYEDGDYKTSGNSYVLPAGDFEFNDFISGDIGSVVVIETAPGSPAAFGEVAINAKTEEGLVYGRIVPLISASKKTSAKLMAAQEYIAGRSSDYDKYFMDQLMYGTYELTELIERPVEDSLLTPEQLTITTGAKTSSVRYIIKTRKDSTGQYVPVRINGGVNRYGLRVVQADANDIDWEHSFDTRLDTLKAIVANTQAQIEGAELARETRKRIIESGESEKAKERARLEKDQIEQVIKAETRKLVERENLLAAQAEEETAKVKKRTIQLLADAESYKNEQLVSAGLTPQEQAYWNYRRDSVAYAELAKLKLPSTVFTSDGGQGNGDGLLSQILGAELLKGRMGAGN